jgi:ABC-type transporter Mla subunit MlaD
MSTDEQLQRVTNILDSLAATVVAHDNQIEKLIEAAEKHQAQLVNLEKQWQAYINTLPRR